MMPPLLELKLTNQAICPEKSLCVREKMNFSVSMLCGFSRKEYDRWLTSIRLSINSMNPPVGM